MAAKFELNPNNFNFIKYIKLVVLIATKTSSTISRLSKKNLKIKLASQGNQIKHHTISKKIDQQHKQLHLGKLQLKSCHDLELDNEDINWSQTYESNYYSTNETKLRSFQMRLNLRSIVTKKQLHGCEMIDSNVYEFCLKETETLLHLFCECSIIVHQFWNNVFDFISTKSGIDLICNSKHRLFGFQEKGNEFCFINELLLCARFLIYRCKYSKTMPNMLQYFNVLNSMRIFEHCIAKSNNILASNFRK